ncbi:MAG: hypothetical protein HFF84_13440 [Oscillibacter sp.]|nr:hypothetical protein [Oscillibacter sp.]
MVEIKVTGNTPLEALSSLTAFATHCMSNKDVWNAANRILEAERHEERKKAAAQAAEQPPEFPKDYDVAPEDPSGPAAGATGPSAAPTEKAAPPAPVPEKPQEAPAPQPAPGKAPSLEDIRAKGIEAAKKYGQPAIKAILKELGAENMTNLPEDKRAVFLEKLEGLGESNA